MPDPAREKPIGIFGGTFDPIHYGHLRLAEEAVDALDLAAVRWIPAGQPALRAAPRATPAQRLAMVRRAVAGHPRFTVDGAEVAAAQPSYTIHTLERLRGADYCGELRPLVLLIGADAFARLPGWHRWQTLFDLAHVAIAERPGFAIAAETLPSALADCFRARLCAQPAELAVAPAGRVVTFAMTPLAISATRIRQLLAAGRSARYLLPEDVLDYIRQQHLYLEN